MAAPIAWIEHNGTRLLFEDFSDISGDDMLELIRANDEFTVALERKNLLLLVDVSGVMGDKRAVRAFKESASQNSDLYDKVAVIGVVGIHRVFLNAVNRFSNLGVKAFPDKVSALDWLTG